MICAFLSWLREHFLVMLLALTTALFITFLPIETYANTDIVTNVLIVLNKVVSLLIDLFILIIDIAILAMQYFMHKASEIDPQITIVWTYIRDLANYGFIFLLMIAAFLNIFDIQWGDFDIHSLIPKFIVAALMVNFSYLFVYLLVDFADVLEAFIYTKLSVGTLGPHAAGIGEALGTALQYNTLDTASALDVSALLIRSLVSAIILYFMMFEFIALAAINATRIFWIWILSILSPLYFLGKTTSLLSKLSDDWMSNLTKWVFVNVKIAFFLSLAVTTAVTLAPSDYTQLNENLPIVASEARSTDPASIEDINKVIGVTNEEDPLSIPSLLRYAFVLGVIFLGIQQAITGSGMAPSQLSASALRGRFESRAKKVGKGALATADFGGNKMLEKIGKLFDNSEAKKKDGDAAAKNAIAQLGDKKKDHAEKKAAEYADKAYEEHIASGKDASTFIKKDVIEARKKEILDNNEFHDHEDVQAARKASDDKYDNSRGAKIAKQFKAAKSGAMNILTAPTRVLGGIKADREKYQYQREKFMGQFDPAKTITYAEKNKALEGMKKKDEKSTDNELFDLKLNKLEEELGNIDRLQDPDAYESKQYEIDMHRQSKSSEAIREAEKKFAGLGADGLKRYLESKDLGVKDKDGKLVLTSKSKELDIMGAAELTAAFNMLRKSDPNSDGGKYLVANGLSGLMDNSSISSAVNSGNDKLFNYLLGDALYQATGKSAKDFQDGALAVKSTREKANRSLVNDTVDQDSQAQFKFLNDNLATAKSRFNNGTGFIDRNSFNKIQQVIKHDDVDLDVNQLEQFELSISDFLNEAQTHSSTKRDISRLEKLKNTIQKKKSAVHDKKGSELVRSKGQNLSRILSSSYPQGLSPDSLPEIQSALKSIKNISIHDLRDFQSAITQSSLPLSDPEVEVIISDLNQKFSNGLKDINSNQKYDVLKDYLQLNLSDPVIVERAMDKNFVVPRSGIVVPGSPSHGSEVKQLINDRASDPGALYANDFQKRKASLINKVDKS